MSANGIAWLSTKESRQKAKLEIAQAKRQGKTVANDGSITGNIDTTKPYYRSNNIYDIAELPTQYSGDNVIDNPNPDGLLLGRPWIDISRSNLELYIVPNSSSSYPGSGTTIRDLSTNGYTGTLMNGVGYLNGGLTFDGVNDYIDMNSTVTSDDFTVINWFKCSTDVSAFRMLVSKETPAGTPWNYRIYIAQGSGQIVGDIADNSGGVNVISDDSYNDDTWHMVAFSRNSTSKTLSLYIDGYLIKQATDTLTGSITNSQEIWFGRSSYTGQSPTGSYPYKGSLGEAMIYNRALISDEILLNFKATRSRYGV